MAVKKAKKSAKTVESSKVKVRVKRSKPKAAVKSKAKAKAKAKTKAKAKVKTKAKSRVTIYKEKQTRLKIFQSISETVGLTKTQVEAVFDALVDIMKGHLHKRGPREITLPKLGVKLRTVKKPATKARKMISPLTGKEVIIAAKPARYVIKVVALKVLKDMAN